MISWRWGAVLALALMGAGPRRAPVQYGPPRPPTPYDMCEQAVEAARPQQMPETLMPAISRVESGRLDPVTGRARPWPWTINVNGVGYYFETKDQAVASVQDLQARGTHSIDVGCMQVNLFFHPTAFATTEDAFDPAINASYAARFLVGLYGQTRDWPLATAFYHSQTQEFGEDYQRRVFGQVMTPMGPPMVATSLAAALKPPTGPYGAFPAAPSPFAALPPASFAFGAFAPPPDKSARAGAGRALERFDKGQATARR